MTVLRRIPFTCWGVAAIALIMVLGIIDAQYDDQGVGGFLVLTMAIWAFPFWFVGEWGFSWWLGFVLCAACDYALSFVRRSSNRADR